MNDAQTAELVQAYYDSWKEGIESFDEARLRRILAPDLHFEGPISGSRDDAEPFLLGLADFVRSVQSYQPLQQVAAGDQASALYDCALSPSGGTMRFAEFFRVRDGRIQELRLLYDPNEFRRLRHPRG
jgi:ketosteroid isomerase-like protein